MEPVPGGHGLPRLILPDGPGPLQPLIRLTAFLSSPFFLFPLGRTTQGEPTFKGQPQATSIKPQGNTTKRLSDSSTLRDATDYRDETDQIQALLRRITRRQQLTMLSGV